MNEKYPLDIFEKIETSPRDFDLSVNLQNAEQHLSPPQHVGNIHTTRNDACIHETSQNENSSTIYLDPNVELDIRDNEIPELLQTKFEPNEIVPKNILGAMDSQPNENNVNDPNRTSYVEFHEETLESNAVNLNVQQELVENNLKIAFETTVNEVISESIENLESAQNGTIDSHNDESNYENCDLKVYVPDVLNIQAKLTEIQAQLEALSDLPSNIQATLDIVYKKIGNIIPIVLKKLRKVPEQESPKRDTNYGIYDIEHDKYDDQQSVEHIDIAGTIADISEDVISKLELKSIFIPNDVIVAMFSYGVFHNFMSIFLPYIA